MRISLKSGSSENKELEIEDSSTVKTLREQVAEKYSTTPNLVVLIFAGKIIKDDKTLTECKIADGLSLHVVLKKASGSAAKLATASTPSTSSAPSTTTPSTPAAATTTPAAAAAAAAPSPADFFGTGMSATSMEDAQQQMMNNPQMMEQMLNNPLVSSVMSDPNVMQELMNSNPQLRGLMDQHPEIRSMMSNPDMMRQAMEMARNPQAMQEMMRGQDRAMQNIESMPGGYNALRRMHEDVVQPMQDAMSPNNPFEQLNNNSNNENAESNTETTSALPNPWGNNSNNSANRATGAARPQMTEGLQNAMMNAMMNNNPAMANIPEEARNQMGRMFADPEAMAAMQRPAVREAMAQIQQGVETINREAPGLARAMGIPAQMGSMPGMPGMSGMSGGAAPRRPAPAADTRTPEVRYATELGQLEAMGFTNKQNNLAALVATNGNLNQAVDRLVGQM